MPKSPAEPKTAWQKHVRAWMSANPGVSYRDALQQAKPSYQSAAKVKTRVAKPKPLPKPKSKTKSTGDHLSAWRAHVSQYRGNNPSLSLKEALQKAKVTYRVVEEKKEPKEKAEPAKQSLSGSGKTRKVVDEDSDSESEEDIPATAEEIKFYESKLPKKVLIVQEEKLEEPKPKVVEVKQEIQLRPRSGRCGCGRRRCSCDRLRCMAECCA